MTLSVYKLIRLGVAAAVCVSGMTLLAAPTFAVEFGTASVLSAQGQRLKVAIPYNTDAGRPVTVVQFQVVDARAPTGSFSPDPAGFTILQSENANMVILQSREYVHADRINLIVGVASHPDRAVRYELTIPR